MIRIAYFWCRIVAPVIGILAAPSALRAQTPDPGTRFAEANMAYDAGRYEDALSVYRELIGRGFAHTPVLYNAANAAFRQGSVGEAVLYYRRAWFTSPRDADIRANLQLAQQRTGALAPEAGMLIRAAEELSSREWGMLASIAFWVLIVATGLMAWSREAVRFARPVATAAGIVLLVSLGGWWHWYRWQGGGEAVVVRPDQTALYEPRESSTPFFALPEGSIVVVEDRFDAWVKVSSGGNAGWLPAATVTTVIPWFSPAAK